MKDPEAMPVSIDDPTSATPAADIGGAKIRLLPGLALAVGVAFTAYVSERALDDALPLPAMVLALLIGIMLNRIACRPIFVPGLSLCTGVILRIAVALLGLRIALADIIGLGLFVPLLVVSAMAATVLVGLWVAVRMGRTPYFGLLAGAATAVCGASATLATATVLPSYRGKEADIAFVVVAVNALSTLAMLGYPPLAHALGLDHAATGVLLGATIHDVAQVVGAGYAVSETSGNTAVIVKLFRVLLLLPIVVAIGWYFARSAALEARAAPVPLFAIAFLLLCILNSLAPQFDAVAWLYIPVREGLVAVSSAGLLVAIAALGLRTSIASVTALGWRHGTTVLATTVTILIIVAAGLMCLPAG